MVSLVHIFQYVLEARGNLPPTEARKKDLLTINYFENDGKQFLRFPNERFNRKQYSSHNHLVLCLANQNRENV